MGGLCPLAGALTCTSLRSGCRGGAPLAPFVVPYDRLILERNKATVTPGCRGPAALANSTGGTAVRPHPPVELVTIPDRLRGTSSLPAVPSTCPTHRSPSGLPRSTADSHPARRAAPAAESGPREGASQA